jgi:hypothetical protein
VFELIRKLKGIYITESLLYIFIVELGLWSKHPTLNFNLVRCILNKRVVEREVCCDARFVDRVWNAT